MGAGRAGQARNREIRERERKNLDFKYFWWATALRKHTLARSMSPHSKTHSPIRLPIPMSLNTASDRCLGGRDSKRLPHWIEPNVAFKRDK